MKEIQERKEENGKTGIYMKLSMSWQLCQGNESGN